MTDSRNLNSKKEKMLSKIRQLLISEQLDQAEVILEAALAVSEDLDFIRLLAQIKGSNHHWGSARKYFKRALELEESVETLIEVGLIEAKLNNNEEATKCFRRVLDLDPDNSDAWANLSLLLQPYDPDAAEEALRKALQG